MKRHHSPVTMAKLQREKTPNAGEDVGQQELTFVGKGNAKTVRPLCKTAWRFSTKEAVLPLPHTPGIVCPQKNPYVTIVTALFILPQMGGNQEGLTKPWYNSVQLSVVQG